MTHPANETPAPISPPAVLSAAQRHDLARQFEQARRLAAKSSPDHRGVHRVLVEVCTLDPGNTLFVAALLENLQNAQGKTTSAWFWQVWKLRAEFDQARQSQEWTRALRAGWTLLGEVPSDDGVLGKLAQICESLDHGPTQIVLLRAARKLAPQNIAVLRPLAIALSAAGQFAEAAEVWQQLLKVVPNDEQGVSFVRILLRTKPRIEQPRSDLIGRVKDLVQVKDFDAAESVLGTEAGSAGGDLDLRMLGEEIAVGRAHERTEIAEELVVAAPIPLFQQLVAEMRQEQRRIELGVAYARNERFPEAFSAWNLASALTRTGNFREAIKYLQTIGADSQLGQMARIAEAENWQHLRQFERALHVYIGVLDEGRSDPQNDQFQRGWYQGAVLAEAMGQGTQARLWLEMLVAANPAYKDASARLVNLRAICNKGGFPAEPQSDSSRGA